MDRLNDFMSVLTGHFNNKEQYERLKTENEKFPYARHILAKAKAIYFADQNRATQLTIKGILG